MSDFAEVSVVVAFASFNGYTAQIHRLADLEIAATMVEYYGIATSIVRSGGGQVVKFIGDAALVVFPMEAADSGVDALLQLKASADQFMVDHGWECRLVVKVHAGTVAAGHFGDGTERRFDVLGKAVNTAARLDSSGFALSPEAFLSLGADMRARFKKHASSATYVREEGGPGPR